MRVFADFSAIPALPSGSVVTIGNFDGVHRGHRALMQRVTAFAAQHGHRPAVLTFDPHPVRVLAPALAPPLICEPADKLRQLAAIGMQIALVQRFDRGFAGLSPAAFVEQVLVQGLAARHVIVGYDFTFGARRAGTTEHLEALGRAHGFTVEVVSAQAVGDGLVASSSKVREFVLQGKVSGAALVLGRPYHVNGVVGQGAQRGRTLGFPTANLAVSNELVPRQGVYAGWLDWGAGAQHAVINIGMNPTFGEAARPTVEAHVIGQTGLDLYDRTCRLTFCSRIRDERRFDSVEALVAQIRADANTAAERLAEQPDPQWP